jgi:hypothetical protein
MVDFLGLQNVSTLLMLNLVEKMPYLNDLLGCSLADAAQDETRRKRVTVTSRTRLGKSFPTSQ